MCFIIQNLCKIYIEITLNYSNFVFAYTNYVLVYTNSLCTNCNYFYLWKTFLFCEITEIICPLLPAVIYQPNYITTKV